MISDPLATAVISKMNTSALLAWRCKDVTEGVFYGADDPVERRDTSETLRSEPETRLSHSAVGWLANQLLPWEEANIHLH